MTTSEAIDVFKEYLTTKIVPRPAELIEASKIAIKVLTQQLEETDKYWKPSEEQMEALERCIDYMDESDNDDSGIMLTLYEQLKAL